MPDALDRVLYRLAVHDAPGVEHDIRVEALLHKAAEYLRLHPAHELHAYLARAFVPDYVQLRVFLVELHKLRQHDRGVALRRENDAVAHHRLQQRLGKISRRAETLTRIGSRQAERRAYLAG